jgi:hypothetical protein
VQLCEQVFVRTSVPFGVSDITNIMGGAGTCVCNYPRPLLCSSCSVQIVGQSGTVRYALLVLYLYCCGELVAVGCLLLFAGVGAGVV